MCYYFEILIDCISNFFSTFEVFLENYNYTLQFLLIIIAIITLAQSKRNIKIQEDNLTEVINQFNIETLRSNVSNSPLLFLDITESSSYYSNKTFFSDEDIFYDESFIIRNSGSSYAKNINVSILLNVDDLSKWDPLDKETMQWYEYKTKYTDFSGQIVEKKVLKHFRIFKRNFSIPFIGNQENYVLSKNEFESDLELMTAVLFIPKFESKQKLPKFEYLIDLEYEDMFGNKIKNHQRIFVNYEYTIINFQEENRFKFKFTTKTSILNSDALNDLIKSQKKSM